MRIAHLSDLHVSRLGAVYQAAALPGREAAEAGWTTLRELDGWRVDVSLAEGERFRWRDRVRLVDDLGLVHATRKVGRGRTVESEAEVLVLLRESRHRTSAAALAARLPDLVETRALLLGDPTNTNLRFCALVAQLRELDPDHLVLTGDLTDDGDGWELITAGLRPFAERGRVHVVPGNHDIYAVPSLVLPAPLRRTEADKRRAWGAFAASVGMPSGGGARDLGEGVLLLCLDSCLPPAIPGSATGAVDENALHRLAGEVDARRPRRLLAALHHHVANPPAGAIGNAPTQTGMRLRNAKRVHELLTGMGVEVVMNGHRHLGYRYHPPRSPLYLSAPSATLGCRTGLEPYFWQLHVDDRVHAELVPAAFTAGNIPRPSADTVTARS